MQNNEDATVPIVRIYFGKSNKTFQYLATISVCFAAVSAGTVLAWSSPTLRELAPQNINNTNGSITDTTKKDLQMEVTEQDKALIGSVLNLGALLYAIPTGYIADKYGRKTAVYSSGAAFILGWIFVIIANNVSMLLVARFFSGMGLGAICVVAPMYIGEIAENSMRGTLSSYFQIFLIFGILITYVIGTMKNYVKMSLILSIFPVLLILIFPFMPESHVYLAKTGQMKEAQKSLTKFRGTKYDYDIAGELDIIREEIRKSKNKSSKIGDLFFVKANRRAAIAVLGLLAFQHLCGINAITFYTEQIFEAAGTGMDPSTGAIIMAVLQLLGGYLGMSVIEKAGRKYFLILSSVGMMLGLSGLGIFFHIQSLHVRISGFGLLPIFCAVMFIVSFTLGYGSVPYVMMHELFSPDVRGLGSGLAIVVAWISSFIVTYLFPISFDILGKYFTLYIMTVINAVAVIFVISFVPETKGKTLIDIQNELAK